MTLPAVVNTDVVVGLIRSRLLAVAEVQALVGPRIYGTTTEDPDFGTVTKPCVVIEELSGGLRDVSGSIVTVPVQIGSLSMVSASEARDVYAVVCAALQAEGLTDAAEGHRGLVRETSAPRVSYLSAAAAWVCHGTWEVVATRDRP